MGRGVPHTSTRRDEKALLWDLVTTWARSTRHLAVTNDTPEVAETGADVHLCRSQPCAAYLLQGRGRESRSLSATRRALVTSASAG